MNSCPICNMPIAEHGELGCIVPMLNYIKELERVADLARQRFYAEASLEAHDELKAALDKLDRGPMFTLRR